MTRNHEQFVRYFIMYRDAKKAYKKIYPTANKESTRTGAARLMAREDVQAAIEKLKGPQHEKEMAELQEIVKEQMKLDIVDNLHRRHLCAQIMLGKQKVPRHFKFKDHTETIYDDPSPAAILRAIELDAKLEYGWHNRAARQSSVRKNGRDDEPLYPDGMEIFIGGKDYDENRQSLLRSLWELDNPDKIKVDTRKNEEGMEISFVEYLVTPPWQNNPEWYEKQNPNQEIQSSLRGDLGGRNSVATCSNDPLQTAELQALAKLDDENSKPPIDTNNTSPLEGDLGVQGYTPLGKTIEEYYLIYLKDQHSINYRNHQNLLKLYNARYLPPESRAVVERQTGWEFHPDNYGYIRKISQPKTNSITQVPSGSPKNHK